MKTTLSTGKRDFPGHKFSRPIVERIFTRFPHIGEGEDHLICPTRICAKVKSMQC